MAHKIFKKDGSVTISNVTVERGSLGTDNMRLDLKKATIPQDVRIHLNNSINPHDIVGEAKLFVYKNELKADITFYKDKYIPAFDVFYPSISGNIKRKQGTIVSMHITHMALHINKNSDLTIKNLKSQIVEIEREGSYKTQVDNTWKKN